MILILSSPPDPAPDPGGELPGPWVHRGTSCNGNVDNVDEPIYGTKTFKKTLKFQPCEFSQEIIRWQLAEKGDSNRDFRMFFSKDGGSQKLDGFSIQRSSATNPGVYVGFEKGSAGAGQVGIKCIPSCALDVKGPVRANNLEARESKDAGNQPSGTKWTRYGNTGLATAWENYTIGAVDGKIKQFRVNAVKWEMKCSKNGFSIVKSTLNQNKGGVLRLDGNQVKYSDKAPVRMPSIHEAGVTVKREFDGSRALDIVKVLKPRIMQENGDTFVCPVLEEIPDGFAADLMNVRESSEDKGRESCVETMFSMLILSIQKLESRIAALEAQG